MLVTTLYVKLNHSMNQVRSLTASGRKFIEDKAYKVYHVRENNGAKYPEFGVVDEESRMCYVPSTAVFICDPKTKKLVGGGDEADN